MKFLSDLPAVNTYVFLLVSGALAYIAFTAGKSAWQGRCYGVTRIFRGVVATILGVILALDGLNGHLVSSESVGLGRGRVYGPGWHVYPAEEIVNLPIKGVFYIPYPNDRQFVEVSYLINKPENLRVLYDEIRSFKAPTNKDELLFGTSKRDAWKVNEDPFAAWLMWRFREYLPTSSAVSNAVDARLDDFLKTLSLYGVSTDAKLMIEHWRVRN